MSTVLPVDTMDSLPLPSGERAGVRGAPHLSITRGSD